ncbi:YitT family protein [Thioclava sp. GXIMD4216]|uniref:YitT family protein n=1 Tax=Thioclava litoralis TaxID=3076557 RepID=A0ABZ1DZP9_9RHOB|nr:YitT family protein [Thioclava sp. FTW29]
MTHLLPPSHSTLDDAQGIAYGGIIAGFGLLILTSLGFVTGQTAGMAVLISYATGWSFGAVFFVINIPFYWLGWKRIGPAFVWKSLAAVSLLSLTTAVLPRYVHFDLLHPAAGAVLFGLITGSALLALFRHGSSLGGIGIVALYLQDKTGFRAGWTQMGFDVAVFALALTLRDLETVAWSFLGAVVMNMVIGINHRRDRYIAT